MCGSHMDLSPDGGWTYHDQKATIRFITFFAGDLIRMEAATWFSQHPANYIIKRANAGDITAISVNVTT